ncbi:hypothetical protein BDF19DRAFT_410913 [Syncephalis fuscata]|nr:hypothetical protein BDF19DRAFT_410913 [Syncephalis fuscata]
MLYSYYLQIICLAALATGLKALPTAKEVPIEHFVVFGDGLSDNGNVFAMSNDTWPSPDFYFKGRFTNSMTWIEWLQRLYNNSTLTNWAYGGATTDSKFLQGTSGLDSSQLYLVPGVKQQITEHYFQQPEDKDEVDREYQHTLFVIWAGREDYIKAMQANMTLNQPLVEQVITNVMDSLKILVEQRGARRFLLITGPSFADSPMAQQVPSTTATLLNDLLSMHDTLLRNTLDQYLIRNTQIHAAILDYRQFETSVRQNPSQLNLADVTQACISIANNTRCDNPNQHYYYDDSHFSGPVHYAFARSVQAWLQQHPLL